MFKTILNKSRSFSPAVKASIAFTICSILQKGIQTITTPIFTRLLTAEQYGQYSLYQTWLSIITVLATLNISAGGFAMGMLKFEKEQPRYISALQGLTTATTISVFLIYVAGRTYWNRIIGLPEIVVWTMFVELLFSPAFSIWSASQKYNFKYKALIVVTLISSILNPVVGIIAVNTTYDKGIARILSASLITACTGIIFYIMGFIKGKCVFDKRIWKYILRFDIPLIPHYLSQVILSLSDRIMIERMFGKSQVAFYSLASSIGGLMLILISSVGAGFSPWAIRKSKEENYAVVGESAEKLLILMAFAALIPIMLAPEAIMILGTREYLEAQRAVPPIVIGYFFVYIYNYFSFYEFYFEKSEYVMMASIIAAVINILLNLVCLPLFGYIAAGYTTAISYMLLMVFHYMSMKFLCKKEGIDWHIYNIRHFFVITVVLIVLAGIFILLYDKYVLRYFMIVIGMLIIVLNIRKVIDRFRESY